MMNRTFTICRPLALAALLLTLTAPASAAPPTPEQLFPASTTEFVAFADPARVGAEWQQTNLAQFLHDPVMRPFLDDLAKHTKGFNYLLDLIGVEFDTVKAAAGGDLGWAIAIASPTEVAHVLTLDMTGRREGAQRLLNEMSKKLGEKGGRGSQRTLDGGMTAVVVDLPDGRQVVYGVKETILAITDHLPTLQGMLARWNGSATNSLANVPAYQYIRSKTQPPAGERPAIRFYFEPIARTEAVFICQPELKKGQKETLPETLRKEGVDGIKGVGGHIALSNNGTDMLIRVAAHTPEPFRGAMRMAKFPNEARYEPESWVPAGVNGYVTFGLDIPNAFDSFETVFERIADEPPGSFKKLINGLRDDKDGPGVDIRAEILEQLQPRITLINDATQPYGSKCERFMVGIPIKNAAAEQVVLNAIRKCVENDDRFKPKDVGGVRIWEYHNKIKAIKDGRRQTVTVPGVSIAVARGQLFIATQIGILEQVLNHQGTHLAQAGDYQHLMKELTRLGMGVSSSRSFVRFDASCEPTFELIRTNRLDQADSIYGFIIRKLLKDDESGKLRADGSKLPSYVQVSKFFGLGGSFTTTHPDGWTVVGAVFKK